MSSTPAELTPGINVEGARPNSSLSSQTWSASYAVWISPDFQGKQADMVDCIRSYLDKLTIPEAGLVGKATDHPGQDLSAEEEGEPLRTQIDELLMQMSIADDGQVSQGKAELI